MKFKFFAFLMPSLILISSYTFSQSSNIDLKNSFETLKTEFIKRNDLLSWLTAEILPQSKLINQNEVKLLRESEIDFYETLDTFKVIDSTSISILNDRNSKLENLLAKNLSSLIQDDSINNSKETNAILTNLEGCENRITIAQEKYNEKCKESSHLELWVGEKRSED